MSYRLLSLDGGDAWALIQSRTLGDLYGDDTPDREILGQFDLVAANSGGSLVAAGVAANMTPRQITGAFLDKTVRDTLFVRKWNYTFAKWSGALPRYKAAEKFKGLRAFLNAQAQSGDALLSQVPQWIAATGGKRTDFLISTFDYDLDPVCCCARTWAVGRGVPRRG